MFNLDGVFFLMLPNFWKYNRYFRHQNCQHSDPPGLCALVDYGCEVSETTTKVIGLITGGEEMAYRREVVGLVDLVYGQ